MPKKISAVTRFCIAVLLMVSCRSAYFTRYQQKTLDKYVWKTKQHLSKTAQLKLLVDRRIKLNPHSVAKNFYPVLDNVSKKLSKIHHKLRCQIASNQAMPRYEIRKIKRALHSTHQLLNKTNQHILNGTEHVLKSDVLFEVGSAQLRAAGVVSLNQFAQYFKHKVLSVYRAQMQVKLNITGYADEQGFVRGESDQQRKEKNRLLSLNRATAIKQYLSIVLNQKFANADKEVMLDVNAEGKGEQLPPKLRNPQQNDHRRRVCTVSSYTILKTGAQLPIIQRNIPKRILTNPSPIKD
ncbi:OmpA family protein [uncultured Microscilla sp.]|uniref:OmpA family protein n=1 Tax=uncultured Microscilla sp. TaxID=432653 RepID=UPI0026367856|nr:OmpA family protein [uncultured Microscilla sp.]